MATTLQQYYQSLGRGLSYPLRVDAGQGGFARASEEALVKQSILQILNTDPSERPYLTKNGVAYGTKLRKYLFSASELVLATAQTEIKQALDVWEPRIIVQSCRVQRDNQHQTTLLISVSFTYRSTNRSDNLVFPLQPQNAV